MSRNEPLKVRIYLCFWSFNEKNDFHRNRYFKTVWGKGGKGEIRLKVLQVDSNNWKCRRNWSSEQRGRQPFKKSKCNVVVLKEKLLVIKKKTAMQLQAVILWCWKDSSQRWGKDLGSGMRCPICMINSTLCLRAPIQSQ